jgi:hypothetical protein
MTVDYRFLCNAWRLGAVGHADGEIFRTKFNIDQMNIARMMDFNRWFLILDLALKAQDRED